MMRKVWNSLKRNKLAHGGTALVGAAVFFAALTTGASAVPDTFAVTTTISASCSVTDAGPGNLTPTYSPTSDAGVGSATTLNTFCTGTTPTVVFTDAYGSETTAFAMSNGNGGVLLYQLSNNATCNGTNSDAPFYENTSVSMTGGSTSFNICAAVIAGSGTNVAAPAGTYQDLVTYTITP
jgi:hypothetical protein